MKKAFTLIEMIIVILIIAIMAVSVSRLYNNQIVTKSWATISKNITMLKYSIWNFPQDINSAIIDNLNTFKPVNSVLLQIWDKWIEKYKYITLNDYKNKIYNNDIFWWFNKVWTTSLDYDQTVNDNQMNIPILKKITLENKTINYYSHSLSDFRYIKSCKAINNRTQQTFNFDLKNNSVTLLLTNTNTFLITKPNKLIDGNDNFIVKRLYCQLIDSYWNEHKIILIF